MSARFSITVQEADGDAKTGLNVDLYANGGAKVGDFIDNGDGTYYISVATSGKYDVYIGGTIQDEMTGIYIPVDDTVLDSDIADKADKVGTPTAGNLAGLDANGNLTDSSYAPADFNQGDTINDLTTGGATDNLSAEQGKTLKTQIGDINFASCKVVNTGDDLTDAVKALDTQVYLNSIQQSGGASGGYRRDYLAFHHDGNVAAGTSVYLYTNYGIQCAAAHGPVMMRSGSITGISVSFTGGDVDDTFLVRSVINGTTSLYVVIENVTTKKWYATIAPGQYLFEPGDILGALVEKQESDDYITDCIVLVEVTYTD